MKIFSHMAQYIIHYSMPLSLCTYYCVSHLKLILSHTWIVVRDDGSYIFHVLLHTAQAEKLDLVDGLLSMCKMTAHLKEEFRFTPRNNPIKYDENISRRLDMTQSLWKSWFDELPVHVLYVVLANNYICSQWSPQDSSGFPRQSDRTNASINLLSELHVFFTCSSRL